jgi:hypothetical protein
MARMIFTILNAVGVAFLLYALVQFLRDGRQSTDTRRFRNNFSHGNTARVVVVTRPISRSTRPGSQVIQLRARRDGLQGKQAVRESVAMVAELPKTNNAA